jgi:hypothetical protein
VSAARPGAGDRQRIAGRAEQAGTTRSPSHGAQPAEAAVRAPLWASGSLPTSAPR